MQWIEPYTSKITVHSSTGNNDSNITPLFGAPYNLDGAGIQVAVFDAGWIDGTHPDLAGRVFHDDSLPGSQGNPIGNTTLVGAHATHMAGIIGSPAMCSPRAAPQQRSSTAIAKPIPIRESTPWWQASRLFTAGG